MTKCRDGLRDWSVAVIKAGGSPWTASSTIFAIRTSRKARRKKLLVASSHAAGQTADSSIRSECQERFAANSYLFQALYILGDSLGIVSCDSSHCFLVGCFLGVVTLGKQIGDLIGA